MFFLPFSESYKLTRQNPNVLELIAIILYQEFFRLKPISCISYLVELETAQVGCRPKNGILGHILQAKKFMLAISKRFDILHILSYL